MPRGTHAPSTRNRTTAEQREQSRERRRARLTMLAAPATPSLPIHRQGRNGRWTRTAACYTDTYARKASR